jgi:hypothetical protein
MDTERNYKSQSLVQSDNPDLSSDIRHILTVPELICVVASDLLNRTGRLEREFLQFSGLRHGCEDSGGRAHCRQLGPTSQKTARALAKPGRKKTEA